MPRVTITSAIGGAATVTLPAVSNISYGIFSVIASYNNTLMVPGVLTISVGGVTIFNVDLLSGSPFIFNETIAGDTGDGIVINLSNMTGLTAKLNVNYTANIS